MGAIIPAILPTSRDDLNEKLIRIEGGAVDMVQIDVVDGAFAQPATWPYTEGIEAFQKGVREGDSLPYLGSISYEVDLMVKDPEKVIGTWIDAGATRLTIHIESTNYLSSLLANLHQTYGHDKDFAPGLLSFGLALDITTDLAVLEPYIEQIEYVQFMGIASIGKQGQPFDRRVLDKVRTLKKRHPRMKIQIDGAVSEETAPLLLDAGASQLVIGSALWKAPNFEAQLKRFERMAEEHGIYN